MYELWQMQKICSGYLRFTLQNPIIEGMTLRKFTGCFLHWQYWHMMIEPYLYRIEAPSRDSSLKEQTKFRIVQLFLL